MSLAQSDKLGLYEIVGPSPACITRTFASCMTLDIKTAPTFWLWNISRERLASSFSKS
jgi:hypothetical protein